MVLDTLEERSDQGNVASALHYLNTLGEVHFHRKKLQKVIEKHGFLLKVEDDSSIVEVMIADLDYVLRE